MAFEFEVHGNLFDDPQKVIEDLGFQPGGRVQLAIDNATVRFMEDYWAFNTGTLAHSVSGQGTGLLTYYQPYAHYMWTGIVYGPNFPVEKDAQGNVLAWRSPKGKKKHPTGKLINYKKDKKPDAGAFPLERMKAAHLNDIIEEAKRVARDK